jgi:hypothetical protein
MTPDRRWPTLPVWITRSGTSCSDFANDDFLLWDVRLPLSIFPADGGRVDRHQERPVEELRPELEQLLREGHLELYEATGDDAPRTLSLDEALAVAADEWNCHGPREPGELPECRIYGLSLTESGGEEFKRAYARANRT